MHTPTHAHVGAGAVHFCAHYCDMKVYAFFCAHYCDMKVYAFFVCPLL